RGVEAVRDGLDYRSFSARISKDRLKWGRRFRPIRSARLRIPFAAFGLKKYRSGTSPVSTTPDNVDSLARLGDSEVSAVKSTPPNSIPEFGQRLEEHPKIPSAMRTEEARNVLDNKNSGLCLSNQSSKLIKEARISSSEPVAFSHSRKREILAREASDPHVGNRDSCMVEGGYIVPAWNLRPMTLQDLPAEGLHLTLEGDLESGVLEADLEAPDAGEERGDLVAGGGVLGALDGFCPPGGGL